MSGNEGPYDAQAAAVIDFARQFAERARLGHIGTEHLLLGMLETGDNPAVRQAGFNPDGRGSGPGRARK
ncbi:MAG: Clp protease N-terminal domain-containing protein [Candidatus Dormibacteria bacterium]